MQRRKFLKTVASSLPVLGGLSLVSLPTSKPVGNDLITPGAIVIPAGMVYKGKKLELTFKGTYQVPGQRRIK